MWPIFKKAGVFVANPDFADAAAFAAKLKANRFGWCAIYVHEGTTEKNASWLASHDWFAALRAAGVRPGVWGFLEGDPEGDAALASSLIAKYDGPGSDVFYIADAEAAYKADTGGDRGSSARFVSRFRQLRPSRTAALSSYGAATWDNLLGSVFDYAPWQANRFDFLPQAYFQDAAEYEPRHCLDQAAANGWRIEDVHPTVGSYAGLKGYRIDGDQWSYLLRNVEAANGQRPQGFSVFNAENVTDGDLAALARLIP